MLNLFQSKFTLTFLLLVINLNTQAAPISPNWFGEWKGSCSTSQIDNSDYKMELEIQSLNRDGEHPFKIKYMTGENNSETRDYRLKPVDLAKGHYVTDERNSIFIDTYYAQDTLTSLFSLNGRVFLIQYKMINNKIYVTMPRWLAQAKTVSGGTSQMPVVRSFEQIDIDQCILTQ